MVRLEILARKVLVFFFLLLLGARVVIRLYYFSKIRVARRALKPMLVSEPLVLALVAVHDIALLPLVGRHAGVV